jgi:uncharacterized membrane protein YeiH
MDSSQIIFILDKIGILAFAFTGVASGVRKKLDIFGLLVVGVSSAIGGGIVRDLLLSRMPFAISNIDYLVFASTASIISIVLFYLKVKIPNKLVKFADTLGLGVFAMAGATASLNLDLSIFHSVLFSVLTAVGGGLIRDLLINEIPFVFKRELYATAAGIGGLVTHIIYSLGTSVSSSVLIGLILVISLRLYSIKKDLHLPIIR